MYADVDYHWVNISRYTKDYRLLEKLRNAYAEFKASNVENAFIVKVVKGDDIEYKTTRKPYHPLQVVQIYFDTATYDEIVKDVSVTLADQLGAIGGTMGLFAGFSFLSAVEVIYFIVKYMLELVKKKN